MSKIYIDFPIYKKRRGSLWSHMFCKDLNTLHKFAEKIGVSTNFFEKSNSGILHYDVKKDFVDVAIANGAIQMRTKDILKIINA